MDPWLEGRAASGGLGQMQAPWDTWPQMHWEVVGVWDMLFVLWVSKEARGQAR